MSAHLPNACKVQASYGKRLHIRTSIETLFCPVSKPKISSWLVACLHILYASDSSCSMGHIFQWKGQSILHSVRLVRICLLQMFAYDGAQSKNFSSSRVTNGARTWINRVTDYPWRSDPWRTDFNCRMLLLRPHLETSGRYSSPFCCCWMRYLFWS